MAKRKANTGICIPRRRSPRNHRNVEEEERKKALARITSRITCNITGVIGLGRVDLFNCLYYTKTIITVARPPEANLPKNAFIRHMYLWTIVERFIELLSISDIRVEKLTFENVPVDEEQLKLILRQCCTSTLKSITIKGDYQRRKGWFNLSKAFSARGLGPVSLDIETYKLPETSVLESISFQPGLKKPTTNDIRGLDYLVQMNPRLQSIKVLNSDNRQVKGTISYSNKLEKRDILQGTLDTLSERAFDGYHSKLERLVKEDMDQSLFIKLKALLWSQTVSKLLSDSSSIPGIFDKDDHCVYSLRTDPFFRTWSYKK